MNPGLPVLTPRRLEPSTWPPGQDSPSPVAPRRMMPAYSAQPRPGAPHVVRDGGSPIAVVAPPIRTVRVPPVPSVSHRAASPGIGHPAAAELPSALDRCPTARLIARIDQ